MINNQTNKQSTTYNNKTKFYYIVTREVPTNLLLI